MKKIFTLIILLNGCFVNAQIFSVTFRVDLSQESQISSTVSVIGDFQSECSLGDDWTPGVAIMTDSDNDSIFELTVNLPAGNYEYKFVNGSAWGMDEGVPTSCAANGNRVLTLYNNEVLPAVCFGECLECVTGVSHSLTFRVDMSQVSAIEPVVSVTGDFQNAAGLGSNWTPGVAVMTDANSDLVYELTVNLPQGTYYFKYVNGSAWGQDEAVPSACAVGGNREVSLSFSMVLDPLCYASCEPCNGAGLKELTNEVRTLQYNSETCELKLSFAPEVSGIKHIEVFDALGRIITSESTLQNVCVLHLLSKNHGVAFVRVITGQKVTTLSFLL
jgi:hypothetical protein